MTTLELRPRDLMPLTFTIAVAQQKGLLQALDAKPMTPDALALALGLDERALAMFLDVLASFDLVRREGGVVSLGPLLVEAVRAMPGRFAGDKALWSSLAKFLADGRPIVAIDAGQEERAPFYKDFVAELAVLWADAAARLARALAGHGPRVLDVGCGSGVWSLALAQIDPASIVTGLDFAPVLVSFEARAHELALHDRIRTISGDAHEIALPEAAFDVVMIANVLRLEAAERAKTLVARAARSIAPQGQLVIVDALAKGSRQADRDRSIYALGLAMRTLVGCVHPNDEVASWLGSAGLVDVESIDLGEVVGAVAALRAWKPLTA
jgi:ubiquinone/menaquinone biosynthesis C-methylase UbiE